MNIEKDKWAVFKQRFVQNLVKGRFTNKMEELKYYYEEMESKFKIDISELSKKYDAEVKEAPIDLETKRNIDEYFSEEHHIIEKIYIKLFRYSTLVTIYSLLETALNGLCDFLKHKMELSLRYDELTGQGIVRAKSYMSKVCYIDFPEAAHEWQEILKFNYIRNCIVHAAGDIEYDSNPTRIRKTINHTKGVELANDRFIMVDSSYIVSMPSSRSKPRITTEKDNSIITNIEKLLDKLYELSFEKL